MKGKIAFEEHFAMPETIQDGPYSEVFRGAWPELRQRLLDLHDLRLAAMDKHGIEFAITSLHNPGIQGLPQAERAIHTARRANDVLAAAVAKRPDRFAGFAALPMQDPDAAITELTRCVTELGFKGAMVNGFSQVGNPNDVVYLDDARYFPFWDAVEKLDVPFYLHPRDPLISREPIYEGHPWLMGSAWAYTVETATHALRMMCSGLFDRYPGLTIILGHMGEALPSAVWRTDQRLKATPRGIPARRKIAEYLSSNFYFTITGVFCSASLIHTMLHVGADRILFSVDYPFIETAEAVKFMDEAPISENDRIKIARDNALRLFKLS